MRFSACFLLLFAAACMPADPTPASGITQDAQTISTAPVFVPALCTLMGRDVRSDVPSGHPVILMWGWSAATREQIDEYMRAGMAEVTFDGIEVQGAQQGGIPFDEAAGEYRAVWTAEVGIPAPGIHTITYRLTFRERIFDGAEYYGPGTKNAQLQDRCEIAVK